MVLRSRLPPWIMLCSVWLLRFAHTGEAQAAKEGKGVRKTKLWAYLLLFATRGSAGGAASCVSAPRYVYFSCARFLEMRRGTSGEFCV